MNILKELKNKTFNDRLNLRTLLGNEENFVFKWNNPIEIQKIQEFKMQSGFQLPKEYVDFLLLSNGATIYISEYEDDGYKLLGIEEIITFTQELKDIGYEIKEGYFCFLQCLFSQDILLFDLNNENNNIIDGDVGYPSDEWQNTNIDFKVFIARLYQCNGAMFWRW